MSRIACHVLVQNDEFWLPYALESVRGVFHRYIIYDVGSTDNTPNIIDWFVESYKGSAAGVIVRTLPDCDPKIQGTFRNAMIAEGEFDWYWILDGDEVYKNNALWDLRYQTISQGRMYGVIRRKEFSPDLKNVYDTERSHHRLYRREATWVGPHPGEAPRYNQNSSREFYMDNIICHHMHNTERSTQIARKRQERKDQKTYHPGELKPIDLLKELPLLRKPINNFPVAPALAALQNAN